MVRGIPGQEESATNCEIVTLGWLGLFHCDKFKRFSALLAESLKFFCQAFMHDAGHHVLLTIAAVEVGARNNPCRFGLVAVAAYGFEFEAVSHHALPLWAVWFGLFSGFASLPEDNKVRDLVGDCLPQKVVQVFI